MPKGIIFFADSNDFKKIALDVEARQRIHYFEAGSFDIEEVSHYATLLDVPELGISKSGISGLNRYYLVLPQDIKLNVRTVQQNAGGVRYFVDQLVNPNSVIIRVGGIWNDSAIIASSLDTIAKEVDALSIFKEFSSSIRKFKKINSFPVGPNAILKSKDRFRFTDDIRNPISQDLLIT